MKPRLIMLIVTLLTIAVGIAQRSTRRNLRPIATIATVDAKTRDSQILTDSATACVVLSGFDKTLRSRRECFFAHNSALDTVIDMALTVSYFDMQGRMLHRRSLHVPAVIPPGETRRLEMPTWDSQQSFYYHRSAPPKRSQATPFDVAICIDTLFLTEPLNSLSNR